ncbi:MAG: DMT family transporter [Sphingomicrobium sp.]
MKPILANAFDRKQGDADASAAGQDLHMIRSQMNRSDWLMMLALALIWGSAFFFISVAVHAIPPLTYVWLRLTIAAAGLWLFLWWKGSRIALPRSVWGSIGLLALLNNALPFALFGWGQTHIASGPASILNATTPIWGVVVAHFFTRDERMTPAKIGGVLLGFGGVAMMIGPALLANIGTDALAQLACVVASLSYAFAAVWARRFKRMGLPPMTVTTGQLTAGAMMMLPIALFIDRPWTEAFPGLAPLAAVSALALLCTAFAYVLYFRLIDRAGATNALLVTLLVPPTAIVLGAVFLGEALAAQDLLGLILIAFGLAAIDGRLVSALRSRRLRRAA